MKEDYPIFVKWTEILNWMLDRIDGFPKSVRFTISNRISNLALDILELIVEAIYCPRPQRIGILNRTNLKMEQLRVLIRISNTRKYLSKRQYEYAAEQLTEAGRMLGGWRKHEAG
ncbi:diversity-generating retroelement protein Avd [bacterium]|nr:diversity-generating retroelement protein Avd [bacterium]